MHGIDEQDCNPLRGWLLRHDVPCVKQAKQLQSRPSDVLHESHEHHCAVHPKHQRIKCCKRIARGVEALTYETCRVNDHSAEVLAVGCRCIAATAIVDQAAQHADTRAPTKVQRLVQRMCKPV